MKFVRKDLSKCHWWNMPGEDYLRALDAAYGELEEAYDELIEKYKRATGNYYLADAHEWTQKYYDVSRENAKLEAEIYKLQAKYSDDMEIMEKKMGRKDKEIKALQEKLEEYRAADNPKTQKKRDKATGQYITDIPKQAKIEKAGELKKKGYNDTQIANALYVSRETAQKYVREFKAQEEQREKERQEWNDQRTREYEERKAAGYYY